MLLTSEIWYNFCIIPKGLWERNANRANQIWIIKKKRQTNQINKWDKTNFRFPSRFTIKINFGMRWNDFIGDVRSGLELEVILLRI